MPVNARAKFVDIHRQALIGRLQSLLSRLEDQNLTREKLDAIHAEVAEVRKKLEDMGFAPKPGGSETPGENS